jgi:hypothetical protein
MSTRMDKGDIIKAYLEKIAPVAFSATVIVNPWSTVIHDTGDSAKDSTETAADKQHSETLNRKADALAKSRPGGTAGQGCPILPDQLKLDTQKYLEWGAKRMEGLEFGTCYDLSCVVIAALLKRELLSGMSLELLSVGNKFRGHVFTVVGRNGQGVVTDPSGWGTGGFILDQWYAGQRRARTSNAADDGRVPVKDLDPKGTYYDARYLRWLVDASKAPKAGMSVVRAFP